MYSVILLHLFANYGLVSPLGSTPGTLTTPLTARGVSNPPELIGPASLNESKCVIIFSRTFINSEVPVGRDTLYSDILLHLLANYGLVSPLGSTPGTLRTPLTARGVSNPPELIGPASLKESKCVIIFSKDFY